jgi:sodium/hydrogen antiporter
VDLRRSLQTSNVGVLLVLGLDLWAAMLLGAALSPTDATLGVSVMSDPRVPARIRRVLNVESGLNDGIATPIVLVAIAGVAADVGVEGPRPSSRCWWGCWWAW